jgi:hypothetical protein
MAQKRWSICCATASHASHDPLYLDWGRTSLPGLRYLAVGVALPQLVLGGLHEATVGE